MLKCKKCGSEFEARAAVRFVMCYSAVSTSPTEIDTGDLVVLCRECLDAINPTGFHLLRQLGVVWIGVGKRGVQRL